MQKISKYQGLIISVSSAVLCLPFILILKLPLIITAAAVFIIVAGPQVYLLLFGAKKAETSTKKESSTDTSSLELKNSLERIALLEAELDRYKNREETACAEFFIMALKAYVFSPVLSELCDSISHNLSSTTEPLSEELLQIKKNISSFLAGVRQYDDEVKNHRMLQKVSEESDMLQSDMTTLDTNVRDVFSAIGTKVAQLKTVNDKIGEVAQNITEVSDKIRILSFNASIEAARAEKPAAVLGSLLRKLKIFLQIPIHILSSFGRRLKKHRTFLKASNPEWIKIANPFIQCCHQEKRGYLPLLLYCTATLMTLIIFTPA